MVEGTKIKEFIEAITPNNWTVLVDDKKLIELFRNGFRKKSSDPNACLYIRMFLELGAHNSSASRFGHTEGHIKNYDGFASCELFVNLKNILEFGEDSGVSWKGTIIHELAHIAVNRLNDFRSSHGRRIIDEEMHGPIFQRALVRIMERAIACYGSELNEVAWEIDLALDWCEIVSEE